MNQKSKNDMGDRHESHPPGSTSDLTRRAARRLAVIGTAGRDRSRDMGKDLWQAMLQDARSRVQSDDELVSGGAAWADHIAVALFLEGDVHGLTLFLPAPLTARSGRWEFEVPAGAAGRCAAGAANFYHEQFSRAIGADSVAQLVEARNRGARVECEPTSAGFTAFFRRNRKVAAQCTAVLAYTFNAGPGPADGGTLDTWSQIAAHDKVHVDLASLNPSRARRDREVER